MANTYEAIATVTVGSGGAANIEFTSIPATYTDLTILGSFRGTTTGNGRSLLMTFNSNTSNRSSRRILGDGSSASSFSSATLMYASESTASGATANTFSNVLIYIPNYAGSNNKSYMADGVGENNATAADMSMWAGLWTNTAAITSIQLTVDTGNFAQYSTATLYGIKNS